MIKVLFICHGNICRSPMAEFIFKDIVKKNEKDDMFVEAGRLVIEQQNASIGMLQRRFRMGFNRAARVIDQLEAEGVISAQDGKKPREVLMSIEDFRNKFGG